MAEKDAVKQDGRHGWIHWIPAALAGGIALLFIWMARGDPNYPIASDTESYGVPGAAFWRGEGFGGLDSSGRFVPEMFRTPLYPLMIGPFYGRGEGWAIPVLIFQALLRAGMVLLLLRVPGSSRNPGLARAGAIAGWLMVFDVPGAVLAGRMLTETLATFLLVACWACFLRQRESFDRGEVGARQARSDMAIENVKDGINHRGAEDAKRIEGRERTEKSRANIKWLLAAGLIGGLNVLCRPVNIVLGLVLLVAAVGMAARTAARDFEGKIWERNEEGGKDGKGESDGEREGGRKEKRGGGFWKSLWNWRTLKISGCFLVAFALFPVLWMGRNMVYSGRPVLSLIAPYNLYFFRAAEIQARLEHKDFYTVQSEQRAAEAAEFDGKAISPWDRMKILEVRARKIIGANPGLYMVGMAMGGLRIVGGPGLETCNQFVDAAFGKGEGGISPRIVRWILKGASLGQLGVVYLLIVVAVIDCIRRRRISFELGLALGLCVILIVAAAGPEAYSRFRVPIMPLLCFAAGIGGAGVCGISRKLSAS